MAVSFFPFNSVIGDDGKADRPGNADNLSAYLAAFFSDGVMIENLTSLQVDINGGMTVRVLPGNAVIFGKLLQNTAAHVIDIAAANATLDRIDRIVVRFDNEGRSMDIAVLQGTPATTPTAPELTRTADIYELCLAEVNIPAGCTLIGDWLISDKRNDGTLCGASTLKIGQFGFANMLHPVGSIYTCVDKQFDPNNVFGGTWVRFGQGRTLVGVNEDDEIFNAAEKTGGSKNAIVVKHNHKPGNDKYFVNYSGGMVGDEVGTISGTGYKVLKIKKSEKFSGSSTTASEGSTGINKNLQPYITVYFWKRTA